MRYVQLAIIALVLFAGCASKPGADVQIQDIHGLALDPLTPTRLYVATHRGLFVSEDERRWSSVTEDPFDMMGFTMHPTNPQVMYASGHPAKIGQGWAVGVVKSTDGGKTWTTLALKDEVDFHAMAMQAEAGEPDTVYGFHDGKFHSSSDGGTTWQSTPVSFSIAALAVEPRNGTVYAASDKGLQRTGRLGAGGWSLVAPGEAFAVATSAQEANALLAYFASGGLKESRDGGRTWNSLNWTAPAGDYPWGIAWHPQDEKIVYAGTLRGKIFKTADTGVGWAAIR